MDEFRLKLNLSNIFNDVRASSFIFVSSGIETIGDLQRHIAKLFKISEDLVLLCDNHFLPGEETVKILKEDEIITVINGGVRKLKKVKKRKVKEDDSYFESSFTPPDGLLWLDEIEKTFVDPSSKRERRKQQLIVSHDVVEKENLDLNGSSVEVVEEGVIEAESRNKQKRVKHSNVVVEEKRRVKSSIVTQRKKVSPMPISTVAKVIQSVKVSDDQGWHFVPISKQSTSFIQNEIESSEQAPLLEDEVEEKPESLAVSLPQEETPFVAEEAVFEEKMDTSDDVEVPIIVKNVEEKRPENKIIMHSSEKLISGSEIETKLQTDSELESKTENESLNDTNSSISAKPKRKRVRKRKSKAKAPEVDIQPLPAPVFRKTLPPIKNVHIKFDDDFNPNVAEPEEAAAAPPSCEKVEEVASPCPTVVESEATVVIEEDAPPVDDEEPISLVVNTAVCRKEILGYPIMVTKPKLKDIVAFKKYVLSENYTPEISDFVIAQVCNLDLQTLDYVLDILEGGEQCGDPNGKFSLLDPEEEPEDINRISVNWTEMIEPRLIYP